MKPPAPSAEQPEQHPEEGGQAYDADRQAELLEQAERQPFPAHLVIGSPEYLARQAEQEGPSGVVRGGPDPEWWEVEPQLNDRDKWDRENCWHHLANPHKPLTARHKEVCRLIAKALPFTEVAKAVGYSKEYISMLSGQPKLRREVARIQDIQLERSIDERMKEMNHKAFDVIEEIIESPDTKDTIRYSAATWLLEKTTGKAVQKTENKESGLNDFMTLLREGIEAGKARALSETREAGSGGTVIDVTPEKKEADSIESWVDSNF